MLSDNVDLTLSRLCPMLFRLLYMTINLIFCTKGLGGLSPGAFFTIEINQLSYLSFEKHKLQNRYLLLFKTVLLIPRGINTSCKIHCCQLPYRLPNFSNKPCAKMAYPRLLKNKIISPELMMISTLFQR